MKYVVLRNNTILMPTNDGIDDQMRVQICGQFFCKLQYFVDFFSPLLYFLFIAQPVNKWIGIWTRFYKRCYDNTHQSAPPQICFQ